MPTRNDAAALTERRPTLACLAPPGASLCTLSARPIRNSSVHTTSNTSVPLTRATLLRPHSGTHITSIYTRYINQHT